MPEGYIIRRTNRRNWVVVDRDTIRDVRLSFRARGVLVYLLDKPTNWRIDSTKIAADGKEGREAIRAALRELEAAGYMVRSNEQDPKTGKWTTVVLLYETPGHTEDGFPGVGLPDVGEPDAGFLGANRNTQKEESTPTGSGTPVVDVVDQGQTSLQIEDPNRARGIARTHLEPVVDLVRRGGSFDLVAMIRDVWTPAWRDAEAQGVNPNAVGIAIAGFFFQYVTDEEPDWGRIGSLVKKFGKLALFGIDEGTGHASDPYRYAFRRCQQAAQERAMTQKGA